MGGLKAKLVFVTGSDRFHLIQRKAPGMDGVVVVARDDFHGDIDASIPAVFHNDPLRTVARTEAVGVADLSSTRLRETLQSAVASAATTEEKRLAAEAALMNFMTPTA